MSSRDDLEQFAAAVEDLKRTLKHTVLRWFAPLLATPLRLGSVLLTPIVLLGVLGYYDNGMRGLGTMMAIVGVTLWIAIVLVWTRRS